MFISRLAIPRRTFLRGAGAALALPLLDAMVPAATAFAKTDAARPMRMGFMYIPHGADMASWTPAASGWLSGAVPKHTEGQDYRIGTTIDQVFAEHLGQSSQFPSIEFATEDYTGYVGGCTPGYSCAYQNTISWATPTTPLPMEINPRTAFERLFGDGGSEENRRRIAREDRSILDSIAAEANSLKVRLAAPDRTRLADYLDHLREIERRIQKTETQHATDLAVIDKPLGIPDSFEEHTALMFELLTMALQAEQTR